MRLLREVIGRGLATTVHATALLSAAACACEPRVSIGYRFCAVPPVEDGGAVPDPQTSVPLPWSTGFEPGFCDYSPPLGFCFNTGSGSFSLVTSPVHSGQYAAAFTVRGDGSGNPGQSRCVWQGVFPGAAYYGAWYYLPASSVNNGTWNLFHFQGGDAGSDGAAGAPNEPLWDLSLFSPRDGGDSLRPSLFIANVTPDTSAFPPIPIGQWFHLEVYFKRAKDATGQISLFVDNVKTVELTGLATDNTDWQQWYVGNFANALSPPDSTLYVDDVTISAGP